MNDHTGADIHTAVRGEPSLTAGGWPLKEAAAHEVTTLEKTPGRS